VVTVGEFHGFSNLYNTLSTGASIIYYSMRLIIMTVRFAIYIDIQAITKIV